MFYRDKGYQMKTKAETATELARQIADYGAGSVSRTEASTNDDPPMVRVHLKDGLSFNLPWDFNPEHFDTLLAVAAMARVKGRDEALLSELPTSNPAH